MNGRALAGVVGVLAVGVAGATGYLLLRDDSGVARPEHHGHAGPSGLESPLPELSPSSRPTDDASSAPPSPSPSSAAPTPAPSTPSTPPRSDGSPKLTAVKAGKGSGLVVAAVGPDGKPVAGAIVEAKTARRHLAPRATNLSGEAALDTVAADEGKVTGTVRSVRFPGVATFTADPGQGKVTVKLGSPDQAGHGSESGFIVGTIRDAHGAAPQHVDLSFYDDSGLVSVVPSESFQNWGGGGQFRAEVAPGNYTLAASGPGYSESDKGYANVAAGRDSTPVDLVLEASGYIAGRVTLPPDLLAQRGPLTIGFDLQCVRGTAENPNSSAKHVDQDLDSDGSFKLDALPPGQYRVRATDNGTRVSAWVSTPLAEGDHKDGVLLALADNGASTVRGFVRDQLGAAIVGATIQEKLVGATTDSSGAFELRGLDPGHHDLVIQAQGCTRRIQSIEVPPAGTIAIDDIGVITLPRCGSVTGVVMRNGAPAAGVSVLAVERGVNKSIIPHGPATTDASGAWRLDGLSPGNYYLKVGDNVDPWDDSGAPAFNVRSSEVVAAPPCTVK